MSEKITALTALTSPASGDVLPVVDVSDTSMAASGTTKKITIANLAAVDWLNVVTMFGADSTGAADATTAISNALAAVPGGGGTVYLPAGTYLLNGSSALALATASTVLCGGGWGATKIKIGASFSAAEVVNISAANCQVRDLSIVGASSTITSNPACNAIEIQPASLQYQIRSVFTQYVNGYSLEASNDGSSPAISHSIVDKFWSYNCAGGIHYNGDQRTVGVTLSNISIGNGGAASGANANLDAILIEDAFDLVWSNCLIGVGNAGTGHCIHIKGTSSAVWFNGFDAGGFPQTLASSQCGVFIEDDVNGNAQRIRFSHGVFQTFGQGAQISGLAQQVSFDDVQFINNVTHGCQLSGTGTQIDFLGCTFSGNGSGGTGSNYDLDNSGTAQGWVDACNFLTTTGVSAGSGPGVQQTVGMASGGTNLNFRNCHFAGSGSGIGNDFQNLPQQIWNCKGYNPHGAATVTVPASGSASGALHYDAYFYITAAAGGTCTILRNTNAQGGGAGPSIVIPAGQFATVFVRAGANITPTYGAGNAPTWVVDGN